MNKRLMTGLVLILLAALVLVFNAKSSAEVNLLFTTTRYTAALVYLCFTVVGVAIGLLVK